MKRQDETDNRRKTMNEIKEWFHERRTEFGYTEEQISGEWAVIETGITRFTGGPMMILPSTSRSAYVSDEAWEEGVQVHYQLADDFKDKDVETMVVSGQ